MSWADDNNISCWDWEDIEQSRVHRSKTREKREEVFTKEELKVIKMSLDGLGANEICTLLDEESFDNTKEKVLSKLKE